MAQLKLLFLLLIALNLPYYLLTYKIKSDDDKKLFCYVSASAESLDEQARFSLDQVDPFFCKTLVYFDTERIVFSDDLNFVYTDAKVGETVRQTINNLKTQNPNLKVLIDFEFQFNLTIFDRIQQRGISFREFARNLVNSTTSYSFDGLSISFENTSIDLKTIESFSRETSSAFQNSNLLLIAFIDIFDLSTRLSYNYFDYILLNTIAFGFPPESILRFITPLYKRNDESLFETFRNVDWIVEYFFYLGVPLNKILLGVTLTGSSYKTNADGISLGSPVAGVGLAGQYTKTPGSFNFFEICPLLVDSTWQNVFNDVQRAPYSLNGTDWITYENVESLTVKAKYVIENDLAGVYLFSIDGDDFSGEFCSSGKFPLTNTLLSYLRG